MLVHFYGPVKGWLPRTELGLEQGNTRSLSTLYREGQVVKCRVLQCKPQAERMTLSLNVNPSRERMKRAELIASHASVGSIVSGVVEKVEENHVIVRLDGDNDPPLKGRISNDRTLLFPWP